MKLTRKQFLAVLARLAELPARLLGINLRATAAKSHQSPLRNLLARRGPWLGDWRQAHRTPVFIAVHPTAQRLILAALRHEMVRLRYWGGSAPGSERCITPDLVFQLDGCGPLYVSAYCHQRRAERVFNIGRLELLTEKEIICVTE